MKHLRQIAIAAALLATLFAAGCKAAPAQQPGQNGSPAGQGGPNDPQPIAAANS